MELVDKSAKPKAAQAKPEEKSDKVAPKATGAKKAETGEGGKGSGETTDGGRFLLEWRSTISATQHPQRWLSRLERRDSADLA